MERATREWVQKAEEDYLQAEQTAASARPSPDHISFNCQQSAEKYLKAILEESGLPVPKTHDLERLVNDLLPMYPTLKSVRRGATYPTQFSVSPRYPGFKSTRCQAASARRWVARIRIVCRAILGLKTP